VVYKPLWNTPYTTTADGTARTIWVSEIDSDALDGSVSTTAHLFQETVNKTADIRVTVVGEQMWASA